MNLSELLPPTQIILSTVSIILLYTVFLNKKQMFYSEAFAPVIKNLLLAIIVLSMAYTIRYYGYIFGKPLFMITTEEAYLGLNILANLFFVYALLDAFSTRS